MNAAINKPLKYLFHFEKTKNPHDIRNHKGFVVAGGQVGVKKICELGVAALRSPRLNQRVIRASHESGGGLSGNQPGPP